MTGVAEARHTGAWWPEGEGRLPFALRIGVTGHRELADPDALAPAIDEAIQALTERVLGAQADPSLLIISALAEGADRLVARQVLARPAAELEVVLPLPVHEYLRDFPAEASKDEFTELLGRAARVWQAPPGGSREEAYERAGRHMVDRADMIIALWDGQPPRGRGGTASIVSYARDQGVPVAWVNTAQPSDPVFWYDQERAARVEEAAREFREYNSAEISEFAARERAEWQRVEPPADGTGQAATLSEACQSVAGWILPYFVRADVLATRVERVFNVTNWTMFLAAAGAVVVVALPGHVRAAPAVDRRDRDPAASAAGGDAAGQPAAAGCWTGGSPTASWPSGCGPGTSWPWPGRATGRPRGTGMSGRAGRPTRPRCGCAGPWRR